MNNYNVGDIVAKLNSHKLYIIVRQSYEELYLKPLISVVRGNESNEKFSYPDEIRMVHRSATNSWLTELKDMSFRYGIDINIIHQNVIKAVAEGMEEARDKFKNPSPSRPSGMGYNATKKDRFEELTKTKESNARYDSLTKVDDILDAINDLSLLHNKFGYKEYLEKRTKLIKRLKNGEYSLS